MPMKMMHGGVEVPTVTPKDFTDLRDVNFTNAQDGDVPTYDSATGKLVNKPAHGVFELWVNSNPSSAFAGQSLQIASDIQYDSLWLEVGLAVGEQILPYVLAIDKFRTGTSYIQLYAMDNFTSNNALTNALCLRTINVSYSNNTYTIAIGDCTVYSKATNSTTAVTGTTNNNSCIPFRILGIIHND